MADQRTFEQAKQKHSLDRGLNYGSGRREEILIRKMIADYLSYRAAILQKDGNMIHHYHSSMSSWKYLLNAEFKRNNEELQLAIAKAEEIIVQTIKNGQP